jgi:hypothetical protein
MGIVVDYRPNESKALIFHSRRSDLAEWARQASIDEDCSPREVVSHQRRSSITPERPRFYNNFQTLPQE